jgi:hypothetical protein
MVMAACYSRAMDVERTIQSILKVQVRHEPRVDALERRLDRRTDAITKILHQGMPMLVQMDTRLNESAKSQAELAKSQMELAKSQKELAAAQKATDRTLRAFINSLRDGRNGH